MAMKNAAGAAQDSTLALFRGAQVILASAVFANQTRL